MARRRRIPLDDLPELGQWDGPIYGELGVLAVDLDGSRVQCHACAGWFLSLATHARLAHQLGAEEYRAVFGLAARHGLVSPTLADRRRRHAERYLVPHHREAGEIGRAVRARQGRTRHQTLSLETRLDPRWQQAMREVGRKIAGRLRDRGLVALLRSLDAAAFERLTAQERDLVRLYYGLDPADPRPRSQRDLIGTTGLGRPEVDRLLRLGTARLLGPGALGLVASCAVCGRAFVRSAVSPARVTCSPACARARGTATGRVSGRPSDAARVRGRAAAALLRAIEERDPAAFGALPAVERVVLRLYHGLPVAGPDVTRPWTKPEIARHLGGGCTVWRVTEALRRALARLRSEEVPSPEERRAVRHARISAAARHRGRAAAALVRALPPEAFERLAEPERTLVRRYYGVQDGRPWTRRELAEAFSRSPEWVARAVTRGTARLLGEQAPRPAERRCTVCGVPFVPGPEAYHTARRTCGEACHRELRRRRAIASRAARKLRG